MARPPSGPEQTCGRGYAGNSGTCALHWPPRAPQQGQGARLHHGLQAPASPRRGCLPNFYLCFLGSPRQVLAAESLSLDLLWETQ